MAQDITFLIVTYNSARVIEGCLKLLPNDQRIIVLDNGSSDSTLEVVSRYSHVEIVRNSNIGYGKAANVGLSMATTPYAMLLNPDVRIDAQSIQVMLANIRKHPDIGMIGANTFHYENGQKIYQKQHSYNEQGLCYTGWIVGALMMFNMQALKKVGLFDENIFLFFEETDLCDRFQAAGFKLAICKHAEAEHEWGTSTTSSMRVLKIRAWHSAWSRSYYYRKHFGVLEAWKKFISKTLKNFLNIIKNLILMRKAKVIVSLYEIMGLFAFFLGIKAYKQDGTARIA
jgi:N-acetylglucosaminyl-diphospho-decaprenol L-rhamnosyltransferase